MKQTHTWFMFMYNAVIQHSTLAVYEHQLKCVPNPDQMINIFSCYNYGHHTMP